MKTGLLPGNYHLWLVVKLKVMKMYKLDYKLDVKLVPGMSEVLVNIPKVDLI